MLSALWYEEDIDLFARPATVLRVYVAGYTHARSKLAGMSGCELDSFGTTECLLSLVLRLLRSFPVTQLEISE